MKKNQLLTVLIIVVIALFLRVYQLSVMPLGISEDEAALGYNAYSIAQTGKDEDGKILPVVFPSFGDYKLPVPVYLTAPFVAVLGLSEWSIRIVSAFIGVVGVVLIFLAGQALSKNIYVGAIGALFLTVSPWHVQLSRFSLSQSLILDLILLQIILILTNINWKKKLLVLSAVQIISLLSHPVAWVVSLPIFIYWLISLKINMKKIVIVCLIVTIGIIGVFTRSSIDSYYLGNAFYKEVGFSNRVNELRGYISEGVFLPQSAKILQNKYLVFTDRVIKNYISGFDFYYLFSRADIKDPFLVKSLGKFYSLELFFFFLGVYYLIKKNVVDYKYIWGILFLTPLAGIFYLTQKFSLTNFPLMIPFYLITAFGVYNLFQSVSRQRLVFYSSVLTFIFIFISSVFAFFHYYFIHFPKEQSNDWHYEYKQISEKLIPLDDKYRNVIVTDKMAAKPYILFLFYQQYDPSHYQSVMKEKNVSHFRSTTAFDKYQFRSINWEKDKLQKDTLIIGLNDEVKGNTIDQIITVNNQDIIKFYDTNY